MGLFKIADLVTKTGGVFVTFFLHSVTQLLFKLLSACLKAVGKLPEMKNGTSLTIETLEDLEKQILMERRLISRELTSCKEGAGVCFSKDQSLSIMVNEEDHLRIQGVQEGFHFKELWDVVNMVDSRLEEELDYAFSRELGYMTACPTNVGTGIRVSVMLHLPALRLTGEIEKVRRAARDMRLAVRGLFGEGSEALGDLYQVSNQTTLGRSEQEPIRRVGVHTFR